MNPHKPDMFYNLILAIGFMAIIAGFAWVIWFELTVHP